MPDSKSNPVPVILPPNYTSITASESFPSPDYGIVTWHTLFSAPKTNTSDMSAGIAVCSPRTGHLCPHRHKQAEIYYIIEGQGEVTISGVKSPVSKGSTVFIPGDAEHGIVNSGNEELKWFYVFPTGSFEDVIYRFSKDEMRGNAKL
jgi:mannose-6-phosphate isomerase-like protein (cupin superfamily)